MYNYDEYERECDKIREANAVYLNMFETEMEEKLKPATIRRHLDNVELYLNDFILREEPLSMQEGIHMLDSFFGDFFIRKCAWSTPGSIKTTAASIKKFYKCMLNNNEITSEDYMFLCSDIKELMPLWQDLCADYNDFDEDNPFFDF